MATRTRLLPQNDHEKMCFNTNPKAWIEYTLEQIRHSNDLVQAVHTSCIKNGVGSADFYMFLSYYALDQLLVQQQKCTSEKIDVPREVLRNYINGTKNKQ